MSSLQCFNQISALRNIFHKAVESVRPKTLLSVNKTIQLVGERNVIIVKHQVCEENQENNKTKHQQVIDLNGKQCHLVGFGKAVLGMAVQIEQLLGQRLVSGLLSVPLGTSDKFRDDPNMQLRVDSVVKVYEGAANNLPDELAAESARRILSKCEEMSDEDVLFVLISGGGSALIALPIDPVTIADKRELIKKLASRQADINEINAVRTVLSRTKGGKLARAAGNAFRVISLVLSDVCGDPLDVIASGPTYAKSASSICPMKVLIKYDVVNDLPLSVQTVLLNSNIDSSEFPQNSLISVIGHNEMACDAASLEAKAQNMRPVIISTEVNGNVKEVADSYITLINLIYNFQNQRITTDMWKNTLVDLQAKLKLKHDVVDLLTDVIADNRQDRRPICIIAGGETTVEIKGSGSGGRNQELALRLSTLLYDNPPLSQVIMLSAGTDGIDGPTTAAGAVGCSQIVEKSQAMHLDVAAYLESNDSFNFYQQLDNGHYHIVTGHTGTNVMDLHIFVIPFDQY